MTITYTVTLDIDGQGTVNVGDQLDRLTVNSGSGDGWMQPDAASCTISFLGSPSVGGLDQTPAWWLGRKIGISMTPSDGTEKAVFYGRVFGVNAEPVDQTCELMQITLQLQSPLADLGQYLITQDQPAQTETVRLNALLDDARDVAWLEVALNLTWSDIDAGLTWAQYTSDMPSFGWDLSTIHDLIPYVANGEQADYVLTNLAMGTGSFFGDYVEMNAGTVDYLYWYTFAGNFADVATSTLDVSQAVVFNEMQANLSLADIYNYVEADNGTEIRSFSVPSSIESFSLRKLEIDTELSNPNDMDTLVANKATGRSTPVQALSQITVDYDLLSDSQRINYVGKTKNINFTNVPASFGGDQPYTVRGMQLDVSYRHAEAVWKVVPQSTLAYFTAWWLLNGTDTWNTYATALTKWSDLT